MPAARPKRACGVYSEYRATRVTAPGSALPGRTHVRRLRRTNVQPCIPSYDETDDFAEPVGYDDQQHARAGASRAPPPPPPLADSFDYPKLAQACLLGTAIMIIRTLTIVYIYILAMIIRTLTVTIRTLAIVYIYIYILAMIIRTLTMTIRTPPHLPAARPICSNTVHCVRMRHRPHPLMRDVCCTLGGMHPWRRIVGAVCRRRMPWSVPRTCASCATTWTCSSKSRQTRPPTRLRRTPRNSRPQTTRSMRHGSITGQRAGMQRVCRVVPRGAVQLRQNELANELRLTCAAFKCATASARTRVHRHARTRAVSSASELQSGVPRVALACVTFCCALHAARCGQSQVALHFIVLCNAARVACCGRCAGHDCCSSSSM